MDVLPWVFSAGWASGVNGYAVVLVLGMLARLAGAVGVPAPLQRADVLVAAAVMCAVDAVADKIPEVDSLWDGVHTAIRPSIGAWVGVLLAAPSGTVTQVVAGVVGGVAALAGHAVKAGLRTAIDTSSGSAGTVTLSSAEDVAVAVVVTVSVLHPWVSAAVAATLLVGGIATVLVMMVTRALRFQVGPRAGRKGWVGRATAALRGAALSPAVRLARRDDA